MLIRDYGSFGMMGHDTGRDCPVPSGMFPSAEEIDAWCNCAYKDPGLNARCKVKYEMGKPIALIAAPWTNAPGCGAAARGLPLNSGGVVCDAVKWVSAEVGKLVEKGVAGITGGNVQPTGGSTQSTSGSATGVTGGSVQPTVIGVGGRRIAPGVIKQDALVRDSGIGSRYVPTEARYAPPQVVEAGMGGMGLVLAVAAGAFLLPKLLKKRSAPALAGYSRRRRR